MKVHVVNAAYGVLDYAAYPLGMLVVAPVVLHNVGVERFGVWAVATAAVNAGGIIASGFGDANIQHIASRRRGADHGALLRAVRSMMGINLLLGSTLAVLGWVVAPVAAMHVV